MRLNHRRSLYPIALYGLIVGLLAGRTAAQLTSDPNPFDIPSSLGSWVPFWWQGSLTNVMLTWDGTRDAANIPTSGSLRAQAFFRGQEHDAFAFFGTFANQRPWDPALVIDATRYTQFMFDLQVDPATAPTTNNNFGYLDAFLMTYDWLNINQQSVFLPLSVTNWTHIIVPINYSSPGLQQVVGIGFSVWSDGQFTNTLTLNVDNVGMASLPCCVPPIQPQLCLERATAGLQFVSTTVYGTDQRQNIYALDPQCSWVNAGTAVTYSVTIARHPEAETNRYFETHVFLIPQNDLPGTPDDSFADLYATNLLAFVIQTDAVGGAAAWLRWNGEQAQHVDTNALVARSAVGTWRLTLDHNTNATLTAPSGAKTNVFLPGWLVNAFDKPVYAYFGTQPNRLANVGALAVLSRIQIAGTAADLDESFIDSALDDSKWGIAAADRAGILVERDPPGYWLSWSNPGTGFALEASTNLYLGTWRDTGLITNALSAGAIKRALVPGSALPSAVNSFWRLHKP